METAVSSMSSMVVVLAPPAVEPGLPPVSMRHIVSSDEASDRLPVGTVSKPAVRGVTAENSDASTRSPCVKPAMECPASNT